MDEATHRKLARNRLTRTQMLLVITWIQQGKTEEEINALALAEQPPFFVSPRKYRRYWLKYSLQRAESLMEQLEEYRAKVDKQVQQFYARQAENHASEQPTKAPAPAALTIVDWVREMLLEDEYERNKSARAKGWDAFRC